MNKIEAAERQRIIDLLHEHGGNRYTVSKLTKRHHSTISRIATRAGIPSEARNIPATKKAVEAHVAYSESRRLEIIGKGFDKADEILGDLEKPEDLQKWTIAVGVLVDKARLETGEATSRNESVDPERRRRMRESLDEVAAQRRARLAG